MVHFHEKVTADYKGPVGDDYLEYLHTHAHELGHAIQEKTYKGPFRNFDEAWADSISSKHPWGDGAGNPFQIDANDKARWLMNYSPYPYQHYTLAIAPAVLSLSLPAARENLKLSDDFWRDPDRG